MTTAPSDIELMMWADGELEEPRRSEVERFIESSAGKESRLKLQGMAAVDAFARSHVASFDAMHAAHADTITEAVMKEVSSEAHRAAERGLGTSKARVSAVRTAAEAGRVDSAAVLAKPGNDNSRLIFTLAALAAAAAVAIGVWGSKRPPPDVASHLAPMSPESALVAPPSSVALAPQAVDSAAIAVALPALLDEPPVKVASVDFGTKRGAIYYVPKDGAPADGPSLASTTTVVWINDD